MADNKASALKQANFKNQLKVYYSGRTPSEDSGSIIVDIDFPNKGLRPWLIKYYLRSGSCYQYINALVAYHQVSNGISQILDAVIVNAKQRTALDKIVDNTLWDIFGLDAACEKDTIIDPCEN